MRGADAPLRLGPVVIDIGRWVYGTVILMTVLVVWGDAQYLLLMLPPLVVLFIGALGAFDASTAVSVIVRGGVLWLVAVGAVAGHRAGVGLWGIVGCAAASGALGLLVITAQVLLTL